MADGFVTIDVNNKLPAVVMAELDTTYAKVRVDNTVGKRVFVTDAAGVEHMVSADTDWRDISDFLINGWAPAAAGRCRLRRTENIVDIAMYLTSGAATGPTVLQLNALGTGFYGYDDTGMWSNVVASAFGPSYIQKSAGELVLRGGAESAGNVFASFTFTTADPWPTTLPGTPG